MSRATTTGLYDRYLLPMVFVVLLLVVRYYQENVQPRLPFACLALVALAAAVSVAGAHDLFAMFRGTLAAAEEVHASGVPERAIDAGWEYDGLTEINEAGFIVIPDRNLAAKKHFSHTFTGRPGTCPQEFASIFPHVLPRFRTSFDSNSCGGRADFSPLYPTRCSYLLASKGDDLRRKKPYGKLDVEFVRQFYSDFAGSLKLAYQRTAH